jgi:hypothetical protein
MNGRSLLLFVLGLAVSAGLIIGLYTTLLATPRSDDELLFEERARRQDRRRSLLKRLGLLRRRNRPGPGV